MPRLPLPLLYPGARGADGRGAAAQRPAARGALGAAREGPLAAQRPAKGGEEGAPAPRKGLKRGGAEARVGGEQLRAAPRRKCLKRPLFGARTRG